MGPASGQSSERRDVCKFILIAIADLHRRGIGWQGQTKTRPRIDPRARF
jgi:hypothetical protein